MARHDAAVLREGEPADRQRWWHSLGAVLLAVAVAIGFGVGPGFRQDEIECEEAAAYLVECCGYVEVEQIDCNYHYFSCSDTEAFPDISPRESECLRSLSCSQIRGRSFCTRHVAIGGDLACHSSSTAEATLGPSPAPNDNGMPPDEEGLP